MGFGKTIDDVKASFELVEEVLFETTIKKNILAQYLSEHELKLS